MAEPEVAGIGAVLKPNTPYLKFVDFHPRGAAALSGKVPLRILYELRLYLLIACISQIFENDCLVSVDHVVGFCTELDLFFLMV